MKINLSDVAQHVNDEQLTEGSTVYRFVSGARRGQKWVSGKIVAVCLSFQEPYEVKWSDVEGSRFYSWYDFQVGRGTPTKTGEQSKLWYRCVI